MGQPARQSTPLIDSPVAVATPKLLRRPPQLSPVSAPAVAADEPPVQLPAPARNETPPSLAANPPLWQDDPRFGVIMVAVVVVINLLLALGLPMLHSVAVAEKGQEASAISAVPAAASSITFYSRTDPISESNPTLTRTTPPPLHSDDDEGSGDSNQ